MSLQRSEILLALVFGGLALTGFIIPWAGIVFLILAGLLLLHWTWKSDWVLKLGRTLARIRLASPIRLKGEETTSASLVPSASQWLLEIAEQQRQIPASHMVVSDSRVMDFRYDYQHVIRRPYVRLRIEAKYLGVHTLEVGTPSGYPTCGGEQLPDYIRAEDGHTNVGPSGIVIFNLDIYIPEEFMHEVIKEYENGVIKRLSVAGLTASIRVRGDSDTTNWHLPSGLSFKRNE